MKNKHTLEDTSASSISEKLKVAEDKLKESTIFNQALISSIGDGVIVVNEYGIITEVNQTALDLLGYEKNELLNEWLPRALPAKDKDGNEMPTSERPVLKSLITGDATTAVSTYTKKDGTPFHVYGTAAPFMIKGKPKGAVIIFRDFTHEMQVENAKDEFVSLASHQLRTPLTSILLYIGLIKYEENSLNSEVKDYLKKIETSAANMQQLIGDFLDISKLELGRLDINPIPINLEELISNQLSDIYAIQSESKVEINFIKPKTSVVANTDPSLLNQALHNLLTNAIRYRCKDKPKITIEIRSELTDYTITIKDNGIGIPEDAQAKIFQRLYRADNAVELASSGTGLGLYLVKKVTEVLGGKVWFESKENVGTSFFIKIPRNNQDIEAIRI